MDKDKKQKDEYVVLFQGAKLSKRDANKAGLGILFGLVGAIIPISFGLENKFITLLIICLFAGFGFFFVGNKIFGK